MDTLAKYQRHGKIEVDMRMVKAEKAWNRVREAHQNWPGQKAFCKLVDEALFLEEEGIERRKLPPLWPNMVLHDLTEEIASRFHELPEGFHPEKFGWIPSVHTRYRIAPPIPWRVAEFHLVRMGRAGMLETHPILGVAAIKSQPVRYRLVRMTTFDIAQALTEALWTEPGFGSGWKDVYSRMTYYRHLVAGAYPPVPWRE